MTISEAIKRLLQWQPPDDQIIVIVWSVADVKTVVDEKGLDLTPEQMVAILEDVDKNHDANNGVSWHNIRTAIEDYMRDNPDEFTEAEDDKA